MNRETPPRDLLERLEVLLEQERRCLLSWEPQRLLELSLQRQALQRLLQHRLRGVSRKDEWLRRRLEKIGFLNRSNLRLTRAAMKVAAALATALRSCGQATYGADGNARPLEAGPLLQKVI
ncbi:MAG: hypothetical protein DRI34_01595 [Deltaproteobacteria bacterium]|nr:MAG: hypothetical protein DRI34_01595 [Deltaproteobacteria bacterium]